jgi:hypothetical protein
MKERTKWEYKTVWLKSGDVFESKTKKEDIAYWDGFFNKMGEDGWELIQITKGPQGAFHHDYAYFKRPGEELT